MYNNSMKKIISSSRFATSLYLVFALVFVLMGGVVPQTAYAAALTSKSDTLSSQKISTLSSHTIKFTTPTGASDNTDTIILTFPSDFNFTSKAISSVTFTHGASTGAENTETLAASPSATAWGAVFSGTQNRVLTLTAPTDGVGAATLAANDKVIITYDSTNSTNASSATSYTLAISGTFGDSGNIVINILSDDQVSVSATVAESLTFTISDNSIGFGTLSSSAAQYATGDTTGSASETEAHTLVVGTNASNGYTMTVNGATLTSGANTITAIGSSNTASSAGTEQFGLRMSASGGSGAVSAPYAASGFAFDTAAFPDQIASASGSSANTTYSVRYLGNITAQTEAGAYTATLTYVATANF
jgi:hypothetical protein